MKLTVVSDPAEVPPYGDSLGELLRGVRDTVRPTDGRTGFEGPRSAIRRLDPLFPPPTVRQQQNNTFQVIDALMRGVAEVNRKPISPGDVSGFNPKPSPYQLEVEAEHAAQQNQKPATPQPTLPMQFADP